MTVKNETEMLIFVLLVTFVSVAASLLLTWIFAPNGLETAALIPAVTVPLLVAPVTTLWVGKLMLRIHKLNEQLAHLVRHDQMTGLLTRVAFLEEFEQSGQTNTGFVMVLDIDRFKEINDTHGHLAGDLIIREVANILKDNTRPDGSAARFGGEEFVTFYPDTSIQHAEMRAEAIRCAVERQDVLVSGRELNCTVSVGLEVFDGSRPLVEVLQSADEALYKAKETGRNRVVRSTNTDVHDARVTA
ncbi:GGDEF domain-containing protein [Roseibium sp.]|uniref:GGDEF domain-containing protein n=1 Tax=Roseibium sp. TaxID=1936156 RepID=UPI003D0AC9DA